MHQKVAPDPVEHAEQGDPLEKIRLIEDPAKNFLAIMTDGRVYKSP